jgi:hypothetical protein
MTNLAGFDFQSLTREALASDEPLNLAADYGVSIIRARSINSYRCLLAYHLTPDENAGGNSVYVEALDEQGERTTEPLVNWTCTLGGPIESNDLTSSSTEPATKINMRRFDTITCWINDGVLDSDSVGNIYTRHADEAPGNSYGSHSYFLVFQKQSAFRL